MVAASGRSLLKRDRSKTYTPGRPRTSKRHEPLAGAEGGQHTTPQSSGSSMQASQGAAGGGGGSAHQQQRGASGSGTPAGDSPAAGGPGDAAGGAPRRASIMQRTRAALQLWKSLRVSAAAAHLSRVSPPALPPCRAAAAGLALEGPPCTAAELASGQNTHPLTLTPPPWAPVVCCRRSLTPPRPPQWLASPSPRSSDAGVAARCHACQRGPGRPHLFSCPTRLEGHGRTAGSEQVAACPRPAPASRHRLLGPHVPAAPIPCLAFLFFPGPSCLSAPPLLPRPP